MRHRGSCSPNCTERVYWIRLPLGQWSRGPKVATLAHGPRKAGTYALGSNGRDDDGRQLVSGVYLSRLEAAERVETRKLLLLR